MAEETSEKPKKQQPNQQQEQPITRKPNCCSDYLPITNDWGDVVGYTPKPADYWEEPGY